MIKHSVPGVFAALVAAFSVYGQEYRLEPLTSVPADLPAAYASVLSPRGFRVTGPGGPYCEVWFRQTVPQGPKSEDTAVSLAVPQGALLGVIRFQAQAADRRGQPIKPGVYTMRYSLHPVDGAHQGVAPQRDFALLTPIASDADPGAMPDFITLVKMSAATVGTSHPAVLSIGVPYEASVPSLTQAGEHDWVLNAKAGAMPLSIIVAGAHEG